MTPTTTPANSDSQRLQQLEAEVAELRSELRQLLKATTPLLPALEQQQAQWSAAFTKVMQGIENSPRLGEARAEGLLVKFNMLLLRLQEVESQYSELRGIVVETYSMIREVREHQLRKPPTE